MEIIIKSDNNKILNAIAEHFEAPDRLQEEFIMDRIILHTSDFEDKEIEIDVEWQKDVIIININ